MLFSIIIPAPKINPYLLECLKAISKQTLTDYEVILVLNDKNNMDLSLRTGFAGEAISFVLSKIKIILSKTGPAEKRDLGAKIAKGKYLAFLDDDSFPSENWLKEAKIELNSPIISAVCGPGVTPLNDTLFQKISGAVNESVMGSGPYNYRFIPKKQRFVDDYPSMNFIIKKADFDKIKGFDTNYWPGEDTKLCLDTIKKLKKKILYDPKILVYHHRRPIFIKHLQQNGRFGLHRGYFARILPATSFRISYFLPSLFTLGVLLGWLNYFLNPLLFYFYLFVIFLYLTIVIIESLKIFLKLKNILLSTLFIPAIIATHLWYGIRFIQGYLFTKKLTK